ncbi:hypothetical protein J7E91_20215 [Streptomyces sp. ISL-99]|nr:hypothetical protein [Streptomyces sp. ISL-99]MBT2527683.1 hypothetical protein [Streptomyces sp. ISL-99]
MHSLGSRPHPAVHAPARVAIQPVAGAALRRDAAGAETPGAGTAVIW